MDNKVQVHRRVVLKHKTSRVVLLTLGVLASGVISLYAPIMGIAALLIGSSLYLLWSWYPLIVAKRIFQHGDSVEGTVTSVWRGGKLSHFKVEYKYSDQSYAERGSFANLANLDLKEGQGVTVFVDPKNPRSFAVLEGAEYDVHA